MRKVAMLAAGALAALAAGCGQQTSQRTAVASYLKQVDRVETALERPLATVTTVGSQFAEQQKAGGTLTNLVTGSHEAALRAALRQIATARGRLAALKTPPVARHLRSLLLQILDGQAQLTREVARLVAFLPRYSAALAPLAPGTRRLEVALGQTASGSNVAAAYSSKAAALRQFKATLEGVLGQLRSVDPPAVSRPDYHAQVEALKGMSTSAGQLASALASGAQANVEQLLANFDRAAASTQSLAAQRARIAAIRAYDGQSTHVARLTQAAEAERAQLANTLT